MQVGACVPPMISPQPAYSFLMSHQIPQQGCGFVSQPSQASQPWQAQSSNRDMHTHDGTQHVPNFFSPSTLSSSANFEDDECQSSCGSESLLATTPDLQVDYDADLMLEHIPTFIGNNDHRGYHIDTNDEVMAKKFGDDYNRIDQSQRARTRQEGKLFKKEVGPMVTHNVKRLFKDRCVDLSSFGENDKPAHWRSEKTVRIRAKKSKVMHEMLRFTLEIRQQEDHSPLEQRESKGTFKIAEVGAVESRKKASVVRGFLLYFTFASHIEVKNFLTWANKIIFEGWANQEAENQTGNNGSSWPPFEAYNRDLKKFVYEDKKADVKKNVYENKKADGETAV